MEAARFPELNVEDLSELLDNKDSKNTKNAIKMAVNVLISYCASKNIIFSDFEKLPLDSLCEHFKTFYASARNQKGGFYSKKSMISLRYGIQRHFLKIRDIDIVNNDAFKPANLVFQAMMVKLKQVGMGSSEHKPPIEADDLAVLYTSFDLENPSDLQNKVFLDFMIYFCNRGRENLRELQKQDFKFHGSGPNKYVTLRDHSTKNHQGDSTDTDESQGGRLYTVPNNVLCPVKSIEKYLAVLNPNCDSFWQRPKIKEKKTEVVWYENIPVGKNTLGNKMKVLSEKYKLSKSYTNHSLRATTITLLDEEGFEARHIMSISGHKSETSIKHYSRTGESKKRMIAETISNKILGNPTAKKSKEEPKGKTDAPQKSKKSSPPDDGDNIFLESAGQDEENFQSFPDDMDLLELSLSQEHALLQTILPESDSPNPSLVATSTSSSTYVQKVLTERAANTNYGPNMVFNHVKEVHMHYHYNTPHDHSN